MNDTERELWVNNNESVYLAWKLSGLSMRNFIREKRKQIDSFIAWVLEDPAKRSRERKEL